MDGAPGMLVHPACRVLRKAMAGGYSYKRVQTDGAAKFRDAPDKNGFSHVAESLQYLLQKRGGFNDNGVHQMPSRRAVGQVCEDLLQL